MVSNDEVRIIYDDLDALWNVMLDEKEAIHRIVKRNRIEGVDVDLCKIEQLMIWGTHIIGMYIRRWSHMNKQTYAQQYQIPTDRAVAGAGTNGDFMIAVRVLRHLQKPHNMIEELYNKIRVMGSDDYEIGELKSDLRLLMDQLAIYIKWLRGTDAIPEEMDTALSPKPYAHVSLYTTSGGAKVRTKKFTKSSRKDLEEYVKRRFEGGGDVMLLED